MTTPAEELKISSMVDQLFATSATDAQLKLRLTKNIQALLLAQQQALLERINTEVIGEDEPEQITGPNDVSLPNHRNWLRESERKALQRIKGELGEGEKMRYRMNFVIGVAVKGDIITHDGEWNEWAINGDTFDLRGSIEEGEVAMLLNYCRNAKLTTLLEPLPPKPAEQAKGDDNE